MAANSVGKMKLQWKKTIILQEKATRLISFANFRYNSSPLFKLIDIIKQSNILFTHNAINKKTLIVFKNYFTLNETEHQHDTINNLNSVYSVPVGSL